MDNERHAIENQPQQPAKQSKRELLPCPFCNGEAIVEMDGTKFFVCCSECDIGTTVWLDENEARKKWNTRANK